MKKSIGKIIRDLRKERNLTQEELAELLNVSGQAISKWENETSMPDISQIVPIASVFGVSTDVLFDTIGKSDTDMAKEIIDECQKLIYDENGIISNDGLYQAYMKAREALNNYPNNMLLLMYCLEHGISLAYPENDTYDALHGEEIYRECIREANLVISYCKNSCDVLRAHMIMVMLHSAYGNYQSAEEHAQQFPWRADMTTHQMLGFIHHAKKEYQSETVNWQNDTFYHLEAMLYSIASNGCAFMKMEQYNDAVSCFEACLDLIATLFKSESYLPPLHLQEVGNIYLLLAEAHLKNGNKESALLAIEQAVDYDLNIRPKLNYPVKPQSPVFRDVDATPVYRIFWPLKGMVDSLIKSLNGERFEALKDNPRFVALCEKLEEAFNK